MARVFRSILQENCGGRLSKDVEEEQSFWKLYIQMVFGTDFMLYLNLISILSKAFILARYILLGKFSLNCVR